MGRGANNQASGAQGLLYGTRARGSGPAKPPPSDGEVVRFLIACAPPLPDDLDEYFGDSRYDEQEWLAIFTERALYADDFTDTAVEEEIVDWIEKGSSFSPKNWASPHDPGPERDRAFAEGQEMKRVIDAYQESDLPVSRQTLLVATNRTALRLGLARLINDRPLEEYGWRERQALRQLVRSGGDKALGVQVPGEFLI